MQGLGPASLPDWFIHSLPVSAEDPPKCGRPQKPGPLRLLVPSWKDAVSHLSVLQKISQSSFHFVVCLSGVQLWVLGMTEWVEARIDDCGGLLANCPLWIWLSS